MSESSLASIHPHLRALATRADRARDQVARLVQLLGSDPLNDPTRMSMFPWSVFLEHYNTITHTIADLSAHLSSTQPLTALFIHPVHALSQADQTALYGGQFAVHDPPLRPIPGKAYIDAREEGYREFAQGVEALVQGKLKALAAKESNQGNPDNPDPADEVLKAEYQALLEKSNIFLESDEHVNLSLLEPNTTSHQTLDRSLLLSRSLLTDLQKRQKKAQAAVGGLRQGFEWGMRLDGSWSARREAEEAAAALRLGEEGSEEDEDDGSGDDDDEDDDEDDEMEQVPAPGTSTITPPTAQPTTIPATGITTTLSASSPTIPNTATIPPATTTTTNAATAPKEVIDLIDDDDDDDDDLFGDNSSTATPGATPGAGTTSVSSVAHAQVVQAQGEGEGESDEDEEMDQVA